MTSPVRGPLPVVMSRDDRVRQALRRARIVANRTPHLTRATRREANRAIDWLEGQLGLNQVDPAGAARGIELLNRAHPSLVFGLLRDPDFSDRFAPALRRLGLRGLQQRLDEVSQTAMAEPIPGPSAGRHHRDELPLQDRVDQFGRPLPAPPGH